MLTAAVVTLSLAQGFTYKNNPNRLYQLKELQRVTISVGKNSLKAWVMDTDSKRQEGMMHLKPGEVQKNDAMLFIFPSARTGDFWMRNTYIPLDIAYVDAKKRVMTIAQMKPLDETGVPSKGAYQYVVEMQKGSFKRLGIKVGQMLTIPKGVVGQ